jgi:hypothetical protein
LKYLTALPNTRAWIRKTDLEFEMLNFDKGDSLIKEIMNSKDPINVVRQHVHKNGGFWNDTDSINKSAIFEIHLYGIRGIGLGADEALKNWLVSARNSVESSRHC